MTFLHAISSSLQGGVMAYSSPVPDLLGTSNISRQVFWEEQSHGLLTDGSYGLQDINIHSILTYGKVTENTFFEPQLQHFFSLWRHRGRMDELEKERSQQTHRAHLQVWQASEIQQSEHLHGQLARLGNPGLQESSGLVQYRRRVLRQGASYLRLHGRHYPSRA